MEKIQGKIQSKKIEQGTSKLGKPYTRAVFTINDKVYSSFDKEIIETFRSSDYVEVELERKGAFLNMVGMRKIDDPSGDVKAEVVKPGSKSYTQFHLSPEECRARALECAIEIAKGAEEPIEGGEILNIAVDLLKFIENDDYKSN